MINMDADLNCRLKYELGNLERAKSEYSSRLDKLRDCKGSYIRRRKHHNSDFYYYVKKKGSSTYRYVGKPDHIEIKRIREARFLEEAIKRIELDIGLIRSLTNGFLSYDPSSVSESLPLVYRYEVPPVSDLYMEESSKWLANRLSFQKGHPENYPEYKRHRTSDGIKVKSISELTTYERFKSAGLAFVYELPFAPLDHGPVLYPDFTILSPIDMETEIIVEFVGRMDRHEYREDFAKRVGKYIAKGFVPGVTLFFLFNDAEGNVDSMQITKVISDIFGMELTN